MSGTCLLVPVWLLLRPAAVEPWTGPSSWSVLPLDRALVDLASGALVACALWAWLALMVTVAEAWRGAPAPLPGPWRLPPAVRRVVLAACGVALASGVAAPALASAGPTQTASRGAAMLSGLPLPDRAVTALRHWDIPHDAPRHRFSGAGAPSVLVMPGDSLWTIAARHLPPDASGATITASWRRIYAANRDLIGADPGRLEPGQRLVLPRPEAS